MNIARRDVLFAVMAVLLVQVELHGRNPLSVVLAMGLFATVCVRRWPLGSLFAVVLVLLGDAAAGGVLMGALLSPLVVVACVAFVAGRRTPTVPLFCGVLGSVAALTLANQVGDPGSFTSANDAVFFAVLVGAPALAGGLLELRSRQVTELRHLTEHLEQRRELAARAARASETDRVERQVDAALVDRLRKIIRGTRRAESLVATRSEDVPAALASVETMARQALGELRGVLGVLHPAASPPLSADAADYRANGGSQRPRERDDGPRGIRLDLVDLGLALALVPLAVETSPWWSSGASWLSLLACAAQAALLVWVRRVPIAGTLALLAVACAQTAFLTALPSTVSWILPALLMAFLIGARLPPVRRGWGLALTWGGAFAVELCTPPQQRSAFALLPMLLAMVVAWWVGTVVSARNRLAAELTATAQELASTADLHALLAAAEQRAEMARELHDVGAHALTVVCLQSGAAQTMWNRDREQACQALGAVCEVATGALTSLSESLGNLGHEPTSTPWDVAALSMVTDAGEALGLHVDVHIEGTPQTISDDVAKVALRVVQESLTNVARHAPGASVHVELAYASGELEVRIRDTGPATTSANTHLTIDGSGAGLRGMRERVEACHGHLDCGPAEAGGFTVQATLPLVATS